MRQAAHAGEAGPGPDSARPPPTASDAADGAAAPARWAMGYREWPFSQRREGGAGVAESRIEVCE